MKIVLIFISLAFTACAQLMNSPGALQPVIVKDSKQKIMFTTCSGSVEDWGSCYRKAGKTCIEGYKAIEKTESAIGGKRELTFKCITH